MTFTRRDFGLVALGAGGSLLLPSDASAYTPIAFQNGKYAEFTMEAESNRVLRARNSALLRVPASLVKMLTAMLVIDALEAGAITWDMVCDIPKDATRIVRSEETRRSRRLNVASMSVRDLYHAMILKSYNEAAITLAITIAGSERAFAKLMQDKAHAIGATQTTIRNASGYYHRWQRSTARDMALVLQHLMYAYPDCYADFGLVEANIEGRVLKTHNHFVKGHKYAEAGKTGYIKKSGFNLAAAACKEIDGEERRIISVLMGGKGSVLVANKMVERMNMCFSRHSMPFMNLEPPASEADKIRNIYNKSQRAQNPFMPAPEVVAADDFNVPFDSALEGFNPFKL